MLSIVIETIPLDLQSSVHTYYTKRALLILITCEIFLLIIFKISNILHNYKITGSSSSQRSSIFHFNRMTFYQLNYRGIYSDKIRKVYFKCSHYTIKDISTFKKDSNFHSFFAKKCKPFKHSEQFYSSTIIFFRFYFE